LKIDGSTLCDHGCCVKSSFPATSSEMLLELDVAAIREQIATDFGGSVAAVARRWPTGEAPHRSTLIRWLRGALPGSEERLLALAGALNIDPLALIRLESAKLPQLIEAIEGLVLRSDWERLEPFTFLRFLVLPTRDWPMPEIAARYFHRSWTTLDFVHDARAERNYYATVLLKPTRSHQVWHFAWRPLTRSAAWRPYGFVQRTGTAVTLCSFTSILDRNSCTDRVAVETWFGEGAAAFRIASMHYFAGEVSKHLREDQAVRFGTRGSR